MVKSHRWHYVTFIMIFIVLISTYHLPVAHARVQNISITKIIDDPYYKETFFVITTSENTYHILVTAQITVEGAETLVDLTAILINPHNATINASARIPDTLHDAPYLEEPVEAFHVWLPDWAVEALKIALPAVIVLAIIGQVYLIIEDIIVDVAEAILEILISNEIVWASIPWVLLTLLYDTNPDGSWDLLIPYSPVLEHFELIWDAHYFLATNLSWWEIVKHDVYTEVCLPWWLGGGCYRIVWFSYFDAIWNSTRAAPPTPKPPQASFEWRPLQPIVNEEINFTSTSFDPDGLITAYHWWLGDGNENIHESLTHVYPNAGEYNVTLKVTDNDGLTDNVTHIISVQPEVEARLRTLPDNLEVRIPTGHSRTAKFVAMESLNQTDLLEATFQASDLKDIEGDIITSGNVTFDKNGITIQKGSYTNVTVTFHASTSLPIGWYNGNITASSQNGGNTTIFAHLYIFGPPLANFTWNPLIPKVDKSITFDASSSIPSGGPITGYEWSFGDGECATGQIAAHTYMSVDVYTVTLNVTDSEGLWDIKEKQVQVVQPHGPTAEFTVTPETADVGESVKFDASASLSGFNGTHEMPITEYRWDFGDSNKTTTFTPVVYHRFSSSGTYYVTLTVYASEATPETDATTHKVTITPVPVGGYSFQIKGYTTARPLTLYLAIVAILATVFTMIRRKTHRRTKEC